MEVTRSTSLISILLNLVTYLHVVLHFPIAKSSNTLTNFLGARSIFSLIGAFISDSYITRFKTLLIFLPIVIMGYTLLALQSHYLVPDQSQCNINIGQGSNCEQIQGSKAGVFYLALYILAFGDGCIAANLPSLGADQFSNEDPTEIRRQSSFFNWLSFHSKIGGTIGLVLIVWLQNNKGWDIGFGALAFGELLGMIVLASGFAFYRNQIPRGSPLTRMLQVLAASFKKRKLLFPENSEELNRIPIEENIKVEQNGEVLHRTKNLKFLDKASIDCGNDMGSWSLCSVTQVEETKTVLRVLPILLSTWLGYVPYHLLLTFTVLQGNTMNTKVGSINISPATLFSIPTIFQLVMIVIYDQVIVPLFRRRTGYVAGITHLQRIGTGFIVIALATGVAALVERRRIKVIEENDLQNIGSDIPMSVLWLLPQFFLVAFHETTSLVGIMEFFNTEMSRGMKSIGTSMCWLVIGSSSWGSTLIVTIVNKVTKHGHESVGWLGGKNLNHSHIDRFYWLLCVLELLAFAVFLRSTWRYEYRKNPYVTEKKNIGMSSNSEEQA